jgi:two-component system nitrogen regulation sensor histidine kinase NtrY
MLALLCASLFFTAVIVRKTYTTVNNLDQTAKVLENNLQKKEAILMTLSITKAALIN